MLKKLFKKGFRILERNDDLNINMMPGDTLELIYTDDDGNENTALKVDIEKEYSVNSAVVFDFENELGMKKGIGGAFGEKE